MTYRKRTTRRMMPESRKVAKLINELNSVATRLKNLLPVIQQLELDSAALHNHNCKKENREKPITFEEGNKNGTAV